MDRSFQNEIFTACRQMTPDEIDAKLAYDLIISTPAYWQTFKVYANPASRSEALDLIREMVKDTIKHF